MDTTISQDDPPEWDALFAKSLDSELNAEEAALLEKLVLENDDARDAYARAAHLHACLQADAGLHASTFLEKPPAPSPRFRFSKVAAIAAALALLAGTWFSGYWQGGHHPAPASGESNTVARVSETAACKWGGSILPTLEGSILSPGMLDLLEGMATLEFDSGATVIMEAPSRIEIVSPMEVRLERGSLVADVPESAIGFTVITEDGKVVDYGTRFGVTYGGGGRSQVIVFDGEVGVTVDGENEEKRILGGRSSVFGDAHTFRPRTTTSEPDRGSAATLQNWQREGWTVVTTREGRGKDSFVSENSNTMAGDRSLAPGHSPLLMVKYSSLKTRNIRHAFLGFDISSATQNGGVEAAELTLQIVPTDVGHAAVVPDCQFTVYGLADGEADHWSETRINPDNAPALIPGDTGTRIDHTRLTPLGQFEIRKGVASGSRTIAGHALVDFLRTDRNGLVTIIIARDTDELADGGLVHAFASKEHPTAASPALKIKTARQPR